MTRRKCAVCRVLSDDFRILPKNKLNRLLSLFHLTGGEQHLLVKDLLKSEGCKHVCWQHGSDNLEFWRGFCNSFASTDLQVELHDGSTVYLPVGCVQRVEELLGSNFSIKSLKRFFLDESKVDSSFIGCDFSSFSWVSAHFRSTSSVRFVSAASEAPASRLSTETSTTPSEPRRRKQDLTGRVRMFFAATVYEHFKEKIETFVINDDGSRIPLRRCRSHSPTSQRYQKFTAVKKNVDPLNIPREPCKLVSCTCCRLWMKGTAKEPLFPASNNEENLFTPLTTPKPQKDDSGGSLFSCSSIQSAGSLVPEIPRGISDTETLGRYFLVEGRRLLSLCSACPTCGTQQGTCPILHVACQTCWVTKKDVQKWEGQPQAAFRMFSGNVAVVSAAITTGNRFSNLNRFAGQLRMGFIGKSTFVRVARHVRRSIATVFENKRDGWLQYMEEEYQRQGLKSLQIAADGSYDSRGYSALIGKTVVCDQVTNLVIDLETMHASETDIKSGRMEVEGLRRILNRLRHSGYNVGIVTTDRSASFTKLVRDYNTTEGIDIVHKFDGWHLVKSLENRLREEAKHRGCEVIHIWTQKLKTHLWNSIKFGETQEDTREIIWAFNCSLHHVAGVHSWPPNPNLTGPYTECSHPPLLGARDFDLIEGDAAFQRVKDCILNKALQRDLPKASMRGTSFCETKNALDRIYCPKEVYFPHSTYHAYSMMSALHLNEQTMSEEDGKRAVTHEYDVKRKYQDRLSKKKVKTEVRQAWRDDVHKEVLRQMAKKRQLAVEAIRARKENRAGNTSSESETEVELDSDDKDVSEWIHATVAEEKERLASRAAVVGMQLDPDSDEDYQERPVQDYAYDIFNGFTDLDYDDYLSKRYNNA